MSSIFKYKYLYINLINILKIQFKKKKTENSFIFLNKIN
jgi:hypothetical protein